MMEVTLKNINISKLQNSAGIFISKKNTLKNFSNESAVNEVVGTLSGNKNASWKNHWTVDKKSREDE
jgi:hypothetical protein